MNLKSLFLLLFLCSYISCFSQDLIVFTLKGKITNVKDSLALEGTTLLNLNSIDGGLSDKKGLFEIDVKENDTVLISHIGFEPIKLKMTRDLSKGTELNIELHPKIETLKEVVIGHKLIGILDIDIKNVPKDKYNRIHINGLPQTYESSKRTKSSSLGLIKSLKNPIDYIYNLFGKKPKRLRDLRKLKERDNTREILKSRFDREIILDYLQMDINKLTETLSNCHYSNYYINKATDLQIIEAVIECYENRKAIKKGNTSK